MSVQERVGRLQDRVAIITGASSGIGRATALAFSREGAHVVCADIRESSHFDSNADETRATTVELIKEQDSKAKAIFVKTDVTSPESVESVVQAAVKEYGRLDIMFNNAGIGDSRNGKPVWDVPIEVWEKTQTINSTGVFLGTKYASAQMRKQSMHPLVTCGSRGWIINSGSILGHVGQYVTSSYCASKGAVVNFTRAAALDCAPERIHVNSIGPGYTESAMTSHLFEDPSEKAKLLEAHPFRGLGTPEDLAKACVFLASEDAQWVSGIYLPVDGGYTAR